MRVIDSKNKNLIFWIESNDDILQFVKSTPKTTTYSSNYSTSNKNSYSSQSSDKKEWNKLTCDPDDYDSPEEYADDAWEVDFDDWDDAYDYWEDY